MNANNDALRDLPAKWRAIAAGEPRGAAKRLRSCADELDAAIRALSADRGDAVYVDADELCVVQGHDDVPRLVAGGREIAAFIPGSWPQVGAALYELGKAYGHSTGDDARHARENPPPPLPPATLLYENEGDGTKVYGYTAEQMQSRPATPSPAESAECRCHEGNGARDCTTHTQADFNAQTAAPSQVSDAMVERAWMAFTGRDKLGKAYVSDASCMMPNERQDIRRALEAVIQPQPGRVEGITRQQVNDLWMRTDCDGSTLTDHLHRFAKELLAAPTAGGDA